MDSRDNEDDMDMDDIDEKALGEAIKGDNYNDINTMITDIYRKKSNMKSKSMFDESNDKAESNKKKVSFEAKYGAPKNSLDSNSMKKRKFINETEQANENTTDLNKRSKNGSIIRKCKETIFYFKLSI